DASVPDTPFNGIIDEVKIYKRALAAEEIRTHYLRGNSFGASGAITADRFRIVNTSSNLQLELNQTSFDVRNNSGQSALYVDKTNSRVGIGTTSPGAKLEVSGGIFSNGPFDQRLGGDVDALRIEGTRVIGRPNGGSTLTFGNAANGYWQTLTFYTGDGASASEKLRIDTNGNIGINTTNPGALLHLNGTKPVLRITPSGTGGDTSSIQFGSPAGESLNAINYDPGSGTFALKVNNQDAIVIDSAGADSNQNITFALGSVANPKEKVVILGTGQVGINVTTPTQTLHVAGTANITAKSTTSFLMTADGNVVFHLE
ncbi:hypothetical protein HYX04_05485, partial [Candidatus Woesearchaeota archaeon]|nr:hypothetical protein [Candidatus Woesearchaeota archaeon]